ncbi:hypothetical protein C8R45DRAFT_1020365 [Mycena sanguinolenta]|nr:hypothetical protein C8R45DRAFT_1020365 [Mycena sanguinolenta]
MEVQEIISLVIDNVVDGPVAYYTSQKKKELAACSLVCRSWLPRTRHHLFRHIVLNERIESLVPLLRSDKCTFAPYVRNISAFRTFNHPNDRILDKIGKDLKRLTNVTTLMLDGMLHACAPFADFMGGFPKVTDLTICFHLTGHSNCVQGMIHMLPALRRLRITPLSPVYFWSGTPPHSIPIPPHDLVPPRHFHDIQTGGESTLSTLKWLEFFGCFKQIDTLELSSGMSLDDAPHVTECLRLMGSTLRHLKLGSEIVLSWKTRCRFESLIDVVDLSVFKNLQTLTVPKLNQFSQNEADYERFLKFILWISSSYLKSIVIKFPGDGYELMNWAALDNFFASSKFPRLNTVQMDVPTARAQYSQENLPQLQELGLLKIHSR